MPREVCEEIPGNSSCFAPPRNIARRHCENVPKLVQREVCKTRNQFCDESCRDQVVEECETNPCSGEEECWIQPEEVCEKVQDETCIGIQPRRKLLRRSALSLSDENPSFENSRKILGSSPPSLADTYNSLNNLEDETFCKIVSVPLCRVVERKVCNPAPHCIKTQRSRCKENKELLCQFCKEMETPGVYAGKDCI